MAWTQLYATPLPPGGAGTQRLNWTRAVIRNTLYMFRVNNPFILRLDTETTPGSPQVIPETPTFLNMGGIQGIAEGRSRLVAWDIVNSIYWSSIDDPLDFTPSLETTANVVSVDAVKGRIVHIVGTREGFIIYTTSNIVTAKFTGFASEIATEVFRFEELSDSLGIFTSDHVSVADNGFHHVWTQAGLFRINADRSPGSPLAEPIFSEVGDYIRQHEGYPRLSHHRDRYFCIWLTYRDFIQGRNILKRNPYDKSAWYNEPYLNEFKYTVGDWDIDFMLDAREQPETYLPPASVGPSVNVDCTKEVLPYRDCEGILWAGYLLRRPPIVVELRSTTIDEWVTPNAAGPEVSIAKDVTVQWYEIRQSTYDDYELIYTQARGFQVGAAELSYGFSPLSFMYDQYIQWVNEKDDNKKNATGLFVPITYQIIGRLHTATAVAPAVDSTFVAQPDESIQVRKGQKWTTRQVLAPLAPGEPNRLRYTNYQQVTDSTGITTESFWIECEEPPLREAVPRAGDQAGWQPVDSATVLQNLNVWEYLTGERLAFRSEDLSTLSNYWYQPGNEQGQNADEYNNSRQVYTLARYYPTGDPELFTTARAIYGITDMCSYASIASFTDRRAFTEGADRTTDEFVQSVRTEDFIPIDNEEWYAESRFDVSVTWRPFDVESDDGIENAPAGYADLGLTTIPRHRLLQIYAIAEITGLGGDPAAELRANLSTARTEYATLNQISGLLQVYRDRGWVVGPPPPGNLTPPALEGPVPGGLAQDVVNGVPQSGILEELSLHGTTCGVPVDLPVNRPAGRVTPTPAPHVNPQDLTKLYGPEGWEVLQPEVVDFTGEAGQGPIYPVYTRCLVYDQQLKRWGSFDDMFYIFLDYNPVNAVSYDPVSDVTVSSFTYDNFLSSLGALLTNRMLHLFDRSPEKSYAVYGKIGYRRRRWTRLTELRIETLDTPSALVILEPSLDGKLVNPYQIRAKQLSSAHDTAFLDVSAQWFNIIITGGRYEIIRFETTGRSAGERY